MKRCHRLSKERFQIKYSGEFLEHVSLWKLLGVAFDEHTTN